MRTHRVLASAIAAVCALAFAPHAAATPVLPGIDKITPGSFFVDYNTSGTPMFECTAGWLAHHNTEQVIITAGHCSAGGDTKVKLADSGEYETVGAFTKSVNDGDTANAKDIGIITLRTTKIATNERINNIRPVTKSVTPHKGDIACQHGALTAKQACGKIVDVWDNALVFDAPSQPGDSGAPVYIAAANGGAAEPIAVLTGFDTRAHLTTATLLQPWLGRWGLTLDQTSDSAPLTAAPLAH